MRLNESIVKEARNGDRRFEDFALHFLTPTSRALARTIDFGASASLVNLEDIGLKCREFKSRAHGVCYRITNDSMLPVSTEEHAGV